MSGGKVVSDKTSLEETSSKRDEQPTYTPTRGMAHFALKRMLVPIHLLDRKYRDPCATTVCNKQAHRFEHRCTH